MRVRRVEPGEEARLRELRLRALEEDPGAFAETLEAARARPEEDWRTWAPQVLVADDGERWLGMIAAVPRTDAVRIYALWVEPPARGTGVGVRLVEAVVDFARERGVRTVELSVTTNNRGAAAFYERAGFAETGVRRPLPADPSRIEVFLARAV